ncbi:nitrilase homolog 1-like [Plakobranchus ocellatus]|uniref:Nitrilase homolog 1-like n=1 Tax=Plakobranchus ocellatus TaxID=259542 RepID=A0AAV4C540_9GAST|nr:nitrilase homolog 1-like [Plakobranchus ocellatus]
MKLGPTARYVFILRSREIQVGLQRSLQVFLGHPKSISITTSSSFGCKRNLSMTSTVNSNNHEERREGYGKALIGVCQMTATSVKSDNMKTVADLVASAKAKGSQMVFLPEACDYIGESKQQTIEFSETLDGNFMSYCRELAVKHGVWLSIGGFHLKGSTNGEDKIKNTHVVIDSEGSIRATYSKSHLFDLNLAGKVRLMESDYVIPGDKVGPPVRTPVGCVGLSICYDMRFPELSLALAQQGAEILTYPSAFTQVTGMAHWESVLRCRAIETQCYVVAAAQTGKHNAKRSSYGHAMVVDPWGAVIAQCSEGTGVCIAEIDLDYMRKLRLEMPVWQHRRTDLYGRVEALEAGPSTFSPDDQAHYQFGHVTVTSSQVFYRTALSFACVNIKPVLPGRTRLKQKDQFKYLGSLISSDGRNNSEVASRIAQAKTNFQKMKTVLTNKNISIRTRRRALECYIEPILMYGCEAWTISKQTQKKLEATEMWFLRRML